jgi:hypothetical protein
MRMAHDTAYSENIDRFPPRLLSARYSAAAKTRAAEVHGEPPRPARTAASGWLRSPYLTFTFTVDDTALKPLAASWNALRNDQVPVIFVL